MNLHLTRTRWSLAVALALLAAGAIFLGWRLFRAMPVPVATAEPGSVLAHVSGPGPAPEAEGVLLVRAGLKPGDTVVADFAAAKPDARVRPVR